MTKLPRTSQRQGTVSVRVTDGSKPIRAARVALVQPHYDVAFPTDSRQFTGAWSIPAWGGLWAATDKTGVATITRVPYGTYDLVLGLNRRTTPHDRVVATTIRRVVISRAQTPLPEIRLVPSIKLHTPAHVDGAENMVRLGWDACPGAAYYSVSIISIGQPRSIGRSGRQQPSGRTCWARSGVVTNWTLIDPRFFLDGIARLDPRGTYCWIVNAYDKGGNIRSTSEHYYAMQEPRLQILPDNGAIH